jgi:RNA polymerase sigma factor (sigma-70 family)
MPERDSPKDDEIQRLIEMREYAKAFEKSYLAYKGPTKARIRAALRGYVDDPEAEAEDLTQNIFEELDRKLPTRYQPNLASVSTYLYLITTGRIRSRLRQIRHNISAALASGKIEESDPHSPNPEKLYLDQEKVEIVKRAMVNKLTPFEMRIIIAFYYEGLSIARIARDEDRSPKNIFITGHFLISK